MGIETNDNQNNGWNVNKNESAGTNVTNLPFYDLIGAPSLLTQNNNIIEVPEIIKSLDESIKESKRTSDSQNTRSTIPTVAKMSNSQSSALPGIVLSVVVERQCYLLPVLFYKKGASEVTESINIGNNTIPFHFSKVAERFMVKDIVDKIEAAYSVVDSKPMSAVITLPPKVINIDRYIKTASSQEEAIISIREEILDEWYLGLWNYTALKIVESNQRAFPNPFREGKLFGKDDSAVARIEATPPNLAFRNNPVPWNLQVKLTTTNKAGNQNINSNNSKSVCTTFLNVDLELMSKAQYLSELRNPANVGRTVGPIIPVISIGTTVPGDQLMNQNSIMTQVLGLYAAIAANQPQCFTEAVRHKEVGNRGNLSNLAPAAYAISERMPANAKEALTSQAMAHPELIQKFMREYICPRAVYVIDIPTFVDYSSNNNFWWELLKAKDNVKSVHYMALMQILNTLSSNHWSAIVDENMGKGDRGRDKLDWVPGMPILRSTTVVIPGGIATSRNGKQFDLREVGTMLLSDPLYYGSNTQVIEEYQSLINGSCGQDLNLRQYNIITKLKSLFNEQVDVDSWYGRFTFDDAFINTLCKSMARAGNLSVNAGNFANVWQYQTSNSYLTNTISTNISNQNGAMGLLGVSLSPWAR